MMRRRAHLQVTVSATSGTSVVFSSYRAQGSSGNHSGNASGGIHNFIRDHRQQQQQQQTSGNFSQRRDGGGGGYGNGGAVGMSAGGATSSSVRSDWAAQLQRELLSEEDPMGGLAHKDYYRDPATGYSPQYAPRNFARGGEVAYTHANSSMNFVDAASQRRWLDHDVEAMRGAAQDARQTSRSLSSFSERAAYISGQIPSDRFASHVSENQSRSVLDQLQHSTVTSGGKLRSQAMVDRFQASASSAVAANAVPPGGFTAAEMAERVAEQRQRNTDDSLEEHLRIAHGERARERFDFTVMQRTSRVPFSGYDMDRYKAGQRGSTFAGQQLPPNTPASSLEEAQKSLRDAGSGDGTPPITEGRIFKAFADNTVIDEPKLGESLTAEVVQELRLSREAKEKQKEQERAQKFGLGRQNALVQDAGPDHRTIAKQTNDERLVDAMLFGAHAYRRTATDEHSDPYQRQNTERGVGHLVNNRFDLQRREDRVSRGEQDIMERSTFHYGTPITQSIDEFVFRHRNARGDRPLDYFKPFPDFRAQRLNRMYQDTEGFALMKQRPDFLEWELFTRYRAHHQQRRELALLHGLEPVANETAQEREARRAALDALCEQTPFDNSRMRLQDDEVPVDVETLRSWFGVYMLPSPTVTAAVTGTDAAVGLHLQHLNDELGSADTREHLLSSRYLNRLLLLEGYQHKLGRGFINDVAGRAPEPVIKYAQSPDVLRHFTAEERAMYNTYVKQETEKQLAEWETMTKARRFVPHRGQMGYVTAQGYPTCVVDVKHVETGAVMTIAEKKFEKELSAAGGDQNGGHSSMSGTLQIDGELYAVIPGSARRVTPLAVQLESGEMLDSTDEEFSTYPLEVPASTKYNHALNYGIADYAYNRGNYVETQDALWEKATAEGTEGWSPATHADGLRAGLPVRARRQVAVGSSGGVEEERVTGDYQAGRIASYLKQPFFNPEPRLVTIAFQSDGAVEQIPLADVLIWQRQYHGPERTVGDESRRYNPAGLRRYVDVADPNNEKTTSASGTAGAVDHFLDKYDVHSADAVATKYRTTRQITEVDQWTRFDTRRPENHRPLSISHRRDYIRQGYMHRFTPWEWIAVQEADQPIIHETMRQDNIGSSHFFSLNRFWRYKARPHGYLRNFENEVRDMFQFIDGVTPWKQAQKIRTYWEVRQHHPMPQFNRPEVAMHRNTAGLLPAHMWETDKKTGKVKGVKDSVRDYQTKTPLPKWVQL